MTVAPWNGFAMKARLALAALLLAGATGRAAPQDGQPPPAPFEKKPAGPKLDPGYLAKVAEIRRETVEAWIPLAEWCEKEGLLLQARYLAEDVLRDDPKHPIRDMVERQEKMDAGAFSTAVARAGKRARTEFEARRAPLRAKIGKRFLDLAKWAGEQKLAAEPLDAYVRAYAFVQDSGTANAALAKAGYDIIFNYGLLSKVEKEEAAELLKKLGGRFLHPSLDKDYGRELASWPDAWGFETRNYQLVSNAHHSMVFKFAEECENLYEGLRVFCGKDIPLRPTRGKERLVVWLFKDEPSFHVVLQTNGISRPQAPGLAGFFGSYGRAYFFYSPRLYEGGLTDPFRSLVETFYHEGTHQMLDLQWSGERKGNMAKYKSAWILEGIANYMETMEVSVDSKGKRNFKFGFHGYDGFEARNGHMYGAYRMAKKGKMNALLPFTTADYGGYQAFPGQYPQAFGLAHYLLHAEGGKWRGVFFQYVKEQYSLGGSMKFLWEYLGKTEKQVMDELVAHCAAYKMDPRWTPGAGASPRAGG
ncbi:MAG: hypothetical protein L0216_14960 [Planctomycetales bacterium]|nr:hypothetical protein [Planctomycetales bacterium]